MDNAQIEKIVFHLKHPILKKDLRAAIAKHLDARYQSVEKLIAILAKDNSIKKYSMTARNGKTISVCCSVPLSDIDTYQLTTSLLPNGYFSNLTAIYHHSLTNQIPNTIYWCHESLAPQVNRAVEMLPDTVIRSAFIKPHRHTNFVFTHNTQDIVVTATTRGTDYGVETVKHLHSPCPVGSRITCLERTLINAVISPHYNGGLSSISTYFKAASQKLDINKLIVIYKKLDFIYPYAQSLGFFMDYCGMSRKAEKWRKAYPPQQKFYIDHGAKSTWTYNERWMLFHPKGFKHEH